MFTTPTVVGDILFVSSCSGVVYAYDRASGAVRWSYDTRQDSGPAQFHGDPAVLGDLLVTGSDTAEPSWLYAFDWKTGAVRWKQDRDVIETDVLVVAGNLVGRTWIGDLVALDPASGARRWRVGVEEQRCGRGRYSPAAAGDRVILPGSDQTLYAVNAASGAVLWRRELGCGTTAPLVVGETVYLGVGPNRILRLRVADGSVVAERTLEGRAHTRLTVANGALIAQVENQNLVAFDLALGEELWRRESPSEWSAFRPLVWKGGVVVGDAKGGVFLLDPRDGAIRWSTEVGGTVRGLGAEGDVLYVGTLRGMVHALSPQVGEGAAGPPIAYAR